MPDVRVALRESKEQLIQMIVDGEPLAGEETEQTFLPVGIMQTTQSTTQQEVTL